MARLLGWCYRDGMSDWDDGGTPAWRRRHAPPVIHVRKRRTLRDITFVEVLSLIVFAVFAPFAAVFLVPAAGALAQWLWR